MSGDDKEVEATPITPAVMTLTSNNIVEGSVEKEAVVGATPGSKSGVNDNKGGDVEKVRSASGASGESEPKAEDVSVEGLGKAVKRAMEDFSAAISASKPTKKPRYSNTNNNDDNESLDSYYADNMYTNPGILGLSIHSYNGVVPPDMLRLDERHTPLDVKAFISRVQTYDLLFWPNKPERLNAFQCSRYGWKIAGMNTLVCVSCHRVEIVPKNVPSSMSLNEWIVQIEERIKSAGHMKGCIWTRTPSPENILMLPSGNDMQSYLIRTAKSFKRMTTVPLLQAPYRMIMTNIDLAGLKTKTGMNLTQKVDAVTQPLLEHTALFLMMNGWSMEGSCENVMKCQRCLREIPLWLSKSTPTQVVIDDILCPISSPHTQAQANIKEFDPVMNHCVWCPWRVQLQEVEKPTSKTSPKHGEEHNFYTNAGITSDITKLPKTEDYLRLACKIDSDFKSGQLLHGDIHEISKNDTAVKTLNNVKDLLNSVTGNKQSDSPGESPQSRLTIKTKPGEDKEDLANDIMAISPTSHPVRRLFTDETDTDN